MQNYSKHRYHVIIQADKYRITTNKSHNYLHFSNIYTKTNPAVRLNTQQDHYTLLY